MTEAEVSAWVDRWTERHGLPRHCEDDRILGLVASRVAAVLTTTKNGIPATEPGSRTSHSPSPSPGTTPANPRGEDRAQQ